MCGKSTNLWATMQVCCSPRSSFLRATRISICRPGPAPRFRATRGISTPILSANPTKRGAMASVAEAPAVGETGWGVLKMDSFKLSPKGHAAKTKTDIWMRRIGLPLGPAAFILLASLPNPPGLTMAGQRSAGAFALALIWWVTEPVPTYVTSLVLMIVLVVSQASDPASVMGVFGLDVIWLNILAFILSAMLVKTDLAKRLALRLMMTFGRRASWALGGFVILQLVLAPLIPATAARAAMTLPLMLA